MFHKYLSDFNDNILQNEFLHQKSHRRLQLDFQKKLIFPNPEIELSINNPLNGTGLGG